MALNILIIVEFGAQKQRISVNANSSYQDIRNQIYSLFKLDLNKSKYILQRQDPSKPDLFNNIDENLLINDLKHYAINNIKNPVIRLRLAPLTYKNMSKSTNGIVNGEKTSSTSSQCHPDESDRASTTSATTIDIKQLIKKCLSNLKETTENIQLLDRYLHPEDYIDDESQVTNKPSSLPSNIQVNRQISQVSSTGDSRLPSTNMIDELVPALNHLMNTQPSAPSLTITTSTSSTTLPSINKPDESVPILPQTIVNHQIQPAVSTTSNTNVPSRTPNKSFSNRLGMIMPSNQTQTTIVQESKSIPTVAHQYVPIKSKSPVTIKPSTSSPMNKNQNGLHSNEVLPSAPTMPSKPKCKVELKQFEPNSTVEGIVSVASNASYFFLQLINERKDEYDRLSKSLHEYYTNLDKNVHFRPLPGDYCVAMYTEDARWYRARIIRYISDQICEVFYIDYGNMEELPIDLVHEILPDFARLPAHAIACTIAEILPPIGQEGWTKRATYAFAQRCSNERVQATVVDSTNIKWPMHIVRLRVSKTQEDIGASLENCKLARRVSNKEICEFWSNKIRQEQFILYNLQEPYPNRFPFIEQVPISDGIEENTNTFLSVSLQQSSSTESLTREHTPIVEKSKENIEQTISSIKPDEEQKNIIEQNQESTPDISEENKQEQEDNRSITRSSSLNPEATPFMMTAINQIEGTQSISTGDESDDENDSNETPLSTDSSERPRMPIKEEVIVDTSLMPSTPLLRSWLPVEVTHIETPTRFYIRYIYGPAWNLGNSETPELIDKKDVPEKNVVLKTLTHEMTQCYSKQKRVCPGNSYDEGELIAVKSRLQWHRGRFIQYKPDIDFAHIFFVDYGYTRSLPIQMIRPINNRFVLHAEQAHLVHLHQPGQRRGRIEWTTNVIDEFRELTKDGTHLYVRIINEPSTIDLMSYDPLTKKWFSFYEHFVKHLNNSDHIETKN